MMCELCGKQVPHTVRVRLEGTVISACKGCAKAGEIVEEPKPAKTTRRKPVQPTAEFTLDVEYDLVDGYGAKVKSARERRGWTQEDLGKLVNEPHSLIHRIELGKYEPSPETARKLEIKLDAKLLTPHREVEAPRQRKESKEITLGDMVVVRKKK